mmetsp:Transcript_120496/g.384726  ORF Transcript_120496/g.384726 Transcript_120496/m.384726 type:complete len:261 (+) Transcript_120496:816-1598(+)
MVAVLLHVVVRPRELVLEVAGPPLAAAAAPLRHAAVDKGIPIIGILSNRTIGAVRPLPPGAAQGPPGAALAHGGLAAGAPGVPRGMGAILAPARGGGTPAGARGAVGLLKGRVAHGQHRSGLRGHQPRAANRVLLPREVGQLRVARGPPGGARQVRARRRGQIPRGRLAAEAGLAQFRRRARAVAAIRLRCFRIIQLLCQVLSAGEVNRALVTHPLQSSGRHARGTRRPSVAGDTFAVAVHTLAVAVSVSGQLRLRLRSR